MSWSQKLYESLDAASQQFCARRSRASFGRTYEESGDGSASTDGKDRGHFCFVLLRSGCGMSRKLV